MARYPGATWRPLDSQFVPGLKLTAHNRLNCHVAVSESTSLWSFFNRPGMPSSHFYVTKAGTVEQYIDTAYRAEADLDGNDATISVETQGGLSNPNGEKWTPEQVEALAKLYAWCVKTHGIAERIATSSKVGTPSRGLSWHRLGIDGDFPDLPSRLAGRLQRGGGMHYSHAAGKACPGDAKIRQIDDVFARAVELLHPAPKPPEPKPPKPEPEPTPTPDPTPEPPTWDPTLTPWECMTMKPYVARKDSASTWYIITPGAPKPFAVKVPAGGVTPDIRALEAIEYGDAWPAFLKTVEVVES